MYIHLFGQNSIFIFLLILIDDLKIKLITKFIFLRINAWYTLSSKKRSYLLYFNNFVVFLFIEKKFFKIFSFISIVF